MDDIQRKLALIDKQLEGGFVNSYKQIISTSPLVFAAVGLIAGILIQDAFDLSVSIWMVVLAVCAASTAFLFAAYTSGKFASYGPLLLSSCALICFACLGSIRLTGFCKPGSNDIRNLVGSERTLATIRGSIITQPYINRNERWEFAKFMPRDPTSSFYLDTCEVETIAGWVKASGTVRVQVAEPVQDLKAGDYVQMYCWLDRFNPPTNPGQFDTAEYLARKNVFIAASVPSKDGIEPLKSGPGGVFAEVKRKLKERTAAALLADTAPEDPSRGLLKALLLGYRENIDNKTYEAFRKTGLLHFISLSGLHLGILIGIIWWLCKTAGLGKRTRASVCIIALAVFLLIVPLRAPVLRAAIICFIFCASVIFRRRTNPFSSLSLAAIILLLIRPTQLFEAGWQLTFTAVLGIILFTDRIHFFLYEMITDRHWAEEAIKSKLFFRIIAKPGPYLLRLFSMGLAGWVGGAGVLLYHFYTINLLTSIWTVITFPLVAGVLTIGFLKIILSFLLPTLAAVLGVIVTELADWLIWVVKLFARLDISQILIGHVPSALIVLYYCSVLFAVFVCFRRALIKKVICAAMILVIVAFLGITKWQRTYRDNLVLTVLDVGHGQAVVAQLPGKANVLFDAGSLSKRDIGGRIVAPFLDYSGISKIDCIVISHKDIDHINGIPEIVAHCNVNAVYANNAFFTDVKTDPNGEAKFLETFLSESGFKIKDSEDLSLNSAAKIKILWPAEGIPQELDLNENDKSAVLLIEFAGRRILLCSDIERFAQAELFHIYPDLKADVVVVPHHGSRSTTEKHFLENLDAGILICSCSRSRYERQQVIEPVGEAKTFYTPKDGAVAVYIDKDGTIRLVSR